MADEVRLHRAPEPLGGSCEAPAERAFDAGIVDFPAMGALVERVQAAFFAGEAGGAPWPAEIELSPWEAFTGGRVPVEVPLRRACDPCAGRGEIADQSCPDCHGAGDRLRVEPVLVFLPSGVRDGQQFRLRVRAPLTLHAAVDLRVRVR
jgi:hypothetical protein